MINIAPSMLDLLVRGRYDALQLEADRRRLAAAARPAPRQEHPRRSRPSMGASHWLRSLGCRAALALGR